MSDSSLEVEPETIELGESVSITIRTGDETLRLRDSRRYRVLRREEGRWFPAAGTAGSTMTVVELDANETYEFEFEPVMISGRYKVVLNALEAACEQEFLVEEPDGEE